MLMLGVIIKAPKDMTTRDPQGMLASNFQHLISNLQCVRPLVDDQVDRPGV